MMNYIRDFIIGSSFAVVAPFYVVTYYNEPKNYSYFHYTILAPLWFGLWNVISSFIAIHYKLSKEQKFLIAFILSYISILGVVKFMNTYSQTEEQWKRYVVIMFMNYFIVWNLVIYNLDKYIS
jgi:hypothetical protein